MMLVTGVSPSGSKDGNKLLNLAPGLISCLQHHILAYYDVGNRLECQQHAETCHQHTFLSPTS